MAAYFSPNMSGSDKSEVPSSGGSSDDGSWSTGHDQDPFEASIEQLRGSPSSRPAHLFRQPAEDLEEDEEVPSRFDLLRRQQVPIEERRRMPGCGINEFNVFDSPMRAETGPIAPNFFQPTRTAYGKQPSRRHRYPPSYRYGTAAVRVQPQLSSSMPTYLGAAAPQLSPSSSSSSSFSTPPPAYEDFQPGLQSSFLCTPPHQQHQIRENEGHPAYVPSYNVYPPENYYPSPSSTSPPSDQSVFERTPEQTPPSFFQRVRQVLRVFDDMFPTYSQEDGALPHEPDYEEREEEEYDDTFENYYSGSDNCAFQ